MSKVFWVVGRQDGDVRTNCCTRSNFDYAGIVEGWTFAHADVVKESKVVPISAWKRGLDDSSRTDMALTMMVYGEFVGRVLAGIKHLDQ